MQFYNLGKTTDVSFKEAVIQGIATDKTLFFPKEIPNIPSAFWENIEQMSNEEIGFYLLQPFVENDIPEEQLKTIISKTLSFDFPTVSIHNNIYCLELFHGPTLAFKDVGARFMAECLSYFNQNKDTKNTVLVATSGDTGGAVANGFYKAQGVQVVILYPSGKVTDIQERQMTTLGENIISIEIDGTFDDCQDIVKKAFLDYDLKEKNLTSANSINVARWLPQMVYFAIAYKQLKHHKKEIIVSCPSGNFGNICAGILAKKMGLPISHFIASTNINDTIPRYLKSNSYDPKSTKATISNAMDVSNPSNFVRIEEFYQSNMMQLKNELSAYAFADEETKQAMKSIYENYQYVTEPHGAIGYLGLQEYLKDKNNHIGVFLETAHPIKFLDTVEQTIGVSLKLSGNINNLLNYEKHSIPMKTYEQVKDYLLHKI